MDRTRRGVLERGLGWALGPGLGLGPRLGLGSGLGVALGTATPQATAERARATGEPDWARRLAEGGVVLALRHARAPGTFDPPGFRLEDCSTQRNLDAQGRTQAAGIGAWFRARKLKPTAVRSSPWCRCRDTAGLAFGPEAVQVWDALGSPVGTEERAYPQHQELLRRALAELATTRGFEVWVTHMFVLQDLTGQGVDSGEGLVLQATAGGGVRALGRWRAEEAAPSPR